MKLSDVAVRRPITTIMFFAAIVLLGVVSVFRLPMQFAPDITEPMGGVFIRTQQNMSVEELERKIIEPIEGEITQLPNVTNLRVRSWESGAFFMIEFEYGVNVKYRIVDLQERLDRFVRANFDPRSINMGAFPFESSWINKQFMDLVLKGPRDDPDLTRINTEDIREKLEDIDGVAQAEIWGGKRHSVDVRILQDHLQQFDVPLWQVIQRVQTYANEPVFLGHIEEKNKKYFVRMDGQFQSPSEIEDVVVKKEGNVAVRHLGQVDEGYKSRRWLRRLDGQPALGINLEKEALVNPIELSNRSRKVIAALNEELPPGYAVSIVWDQADGIRELLKTLSSLAMVGVLLSMVVLYLFVRDWRMTSIVCVVIPISIIATFNMMYFSNMTLNIVSLLGLAVGVGCLIDSSIVVLENIFRHHEKGKPPVQAACVGAHEVGVAVFGFTLTNVVVFLPIVFVEGSIRMVFTEGALAIIYPMVVSMLVALTLVPMASCYVMMLMDRRKRGTSKRGMAGPGQDKKRIPARVMGITPVAGLKQALGAVYQRVGGYLSFLSMANARNVYSIILKSCLRHRVRFLIVIALVIAYTISYTMSEVNQDVMEEPSYGDSFYVFVYMSQGTKQEATLEVVERVEDMLMKQIPEIKHLHCWMREDEAEFRVELIDLAERGREQDTIREELRPYLASFGDAEVTFNRSASRGEETQPSIDTGQSGVVEVRGPEYAQINTILQNFSQMLSQLPDVRDVISETEAGPLEVHFKLDDDAAAHLQITTQSVAQSIQVAQREGDFASIVMKRGDEEIDILFSQFSRPEDLEKIKEGEEQGLVFEELKQVPVYSALLGSTVPLEDLGHFTIERGMGYVERENRERIGRLQFQTSPGANFKEVEESVQGLIDAFPLTAGYRMNLAGKSVRLNEELAAFQQMVWLALILVYMCIAALFESYSRPLVIMLAIPLATIGVVWSFLLTGTSFDPLSVLGIMFLMGILPNSAILLVHFAGYLRTEKNYPRVRAIFVSGNTRLRPIFMTVLTTILGLLPMAFPWQGDDDWVPFAVPVIGGLLASTVLTLIIVPGFYFIIEDIARWFSARGRDALSWRWVLVFWSREQRLRVKENVTAYRQVPERDEPLLVKLEHLTRIYTPNKLEQLGQRFLQLLPWQQNPALGLVAEALQTPDQAIAARKKAVDTVTLDIGAGLFGLLGPNGAGKTTLLRMVAGIDQPTRGYLSICGYDMKNETRAAQKRIGYLPQYFGVYSSLSAYNYLDYFALLKGIKNKKERDAAISNALEMVNLNAQRDVPVNQFSGGMIRRIGLAQIFLQPPKVLIVDEPTVGLDPLERVRFRNLLSQLSRDRVVILSTHIVEDVAHCCQRLALMERGKVHFQGTVDTFVQNVQNKVWRVTAKDESEWKQLREHYYVVGQNQTGEGLSLRVIADEQPTVEATMAEATLEDAYLYMVAQTNNKKSN